jgi:hypothetical protein
MDVVLVLDGALLLSSEHAAKREKKRERLQQALFPCFPGPRGLGLDLRIWIEWIEWIE